jgi:hypothetical protein
VSVPGENSWEITGPGRKFMGKYAQRRCIGLLNQQWLQGSTLDIDDTSIHDIIKKKKIAHILTKPFYPPKRPYSRHISKAIAM